jgi:hypothetical protein
MYTAPFELSAPAPIDLADSVFNPRPINNIHTLAVNTAEIARKIHPSAARNPLFSANPQTLRLVGLRKPLRFNIFRTLASFFTALSRKHPFFSSTYALLLQKTGGWWGGVAALC